MTDDISLVSNSAMNDAKALPKQNIKTVECQLEMTLDKLAVTETNIELFGTLMKLGLATNDVNSFIQKQTSHKKANDRPNFRVQRAAMRSKLDDACAHARYLRRLRDTLRKRVLKKFSSRKSFCRRLLEDLNVKYKQRKQTEKIKMSKKIDRMRDKSKLENVIRTAPPTTEGYLSDVNLFSAQQNSISPQSPDLPFICDPKIVLSECEMKLLARGPKFMVREPLKTQDFELELEKNGRQK